MPVRPERVLLLRSGRHLQTALDALVRELPGSEITVLATASGASALEDARIPPARRLVYDRTPFFRPWRVLFSPAGFAVLRGRFDRVCVLWTDPEGAGHGNVDRTALLLSPRGFTAITPDGRLVRRRTSQILGGEWTRGLRSMAVAALLGLCVFLPAALLRPFRAR